MLQLGLGLGSEFRLGLRGEKCCLRNPIPCQGTGKKDFDGREARDTKDPRDGRDVSRERGGARNRRGDGGGGGHDWHGRTLDGRPKERNREVGSGRDAYRDRDRDHRDNRRPNHGNYRNDRRGGGR